MGDAVKQNGVLIFVSVSDRAVYISVGSGIREKANDRVLEAIINRMKPHLRQSKFDNAFVSAILDMERVVTLGHLRSSQVQNDLEEDSNNYGFIAIIVCIFAFLGFKSWWDTKQQAQLARGRATLDSLIVDIKNAKHRVYMTTSCPVCLESFTPENDMHNTDPAICIVPKTLPCGHVFCDKCIKEYLASSAKENCPICRENIRHLDENVAAEHVPCEAHLIAPYRLHMQTTMFRLRRIRTLYPNALDSSTHSLLNAAVQNGSLSDALQVVEQRAVEVSSIINNMKEKAIASRKGSSSSSRHSFGGGFSGGGRGGRW